MKDLLKRCGLTAHQKGSKDKLQEFVYKDKRKTYNRPTDFAGKSYVCMELDMAYNLFIWYVKQEESDQDECCVEINIDSKKTSWVLQAGKKNGLVIDSLLFKGESIPLQFTKRSGTISASSLT
jgi:ABC-type uncharacterized transport system YnjBCD substrate-binding protein